MKIVMNKATCIKHNCVLCSTNYGVENFMSDSLKKTQKPANQPTFENGGRSTSKIFFIDDQCSHSR